MENRYKDLEDIKAVFDKFNVKLIVGWGALLGTYRDKKLIEHDDDIDLAVIDQIDLETRKQIGWTLGDLGFKAQPISFNVFGRMEMTMLGGEGEARYDGDSETGIIVCERNFKFTIFFFQEEDCTKHGKEYVCIPKVNAVKLISTPKKFYEKLGEIKINGKKYLTPSPIEKYLEFTYFNNWKDRTDRRHGESYPSMHKIT